jgi:tetratricopeptide (TPR) repeat protein
MHVGRNWLIIYLVPVMLSAGVSNPTATQPSLVDVLTQVQELANHKQFEAANALLQDARDRAVAEQNEFHEAVILINLGVIYEKKSKYADAENAYNRAISLLTRAKGEDRVWLVDAQQNLSALLFESGQFSKAETTLLRTMVLLEGNGKPADQTASIESMLAKVYLQEGKISLAKATAENSLELARVNKKESVVDAFDYSVLGAVYTGYGENDAAEDYFQRALATLKKNLDPKDFRIAEASANLGLLFINEGQPAKAEPLLAKAHDTFLAAGVNSIFSRELTAWYAGLERKLGHKKQAGELEKEMRNLLAKSPQGYMSRYIVDASSFR